MNRLFFLENFKMLDFQLQDFSQGVIFFEDYFFLWMGERAMMMGYKKCKILKALLTNRHFIFFDIFQKS